MLHKLNVTEVNCIKVRTNGVISVCLNFRILFQIVYTCFVDYTCLRVNAEHPFTLRDSFVENVTRETANSMLPALGKEAYRQHNFS